VALKSGSFFTPAHVKDLASRLVDQSESDGDSTEECCGGKEAGGSCCKSGKAGEEVCAEGEANATAGTSPTVAHTRVEELRRLIYELAAEVGVPLASAK